MSGKRTNQKAIMLYVPDFIHTALKEKVKEQGSTITSYVLRALVHKINLESTHDKKINY